VRPSAGIVRFAGEEIQGLPPHVIATRGVRRTFQNGGLFGQMTVLENVLAGLHSGIASNFFGLLLGLRSATHAERAATKRARALLALMELGDLADKPVKDLSGGQQRMVEITRALAMGTPMLLLDEPMVGLTPPVRERLMKVIRRLAQEHGITILLIEHSIDTVMSGADIIVVLNGGQKIAEGTPNEIRQNREVLDAYLGHA
jgi:branched-chain amino acid transport system ATP-binding protein